MRRNLRPDDLGDLLTLPKNAVLATRFANGEILLSPVWHEWQNGAFVVSSGVHDVKVRHLRRDPRASIVVAEDLPPYRGLEVRGRAEIIPTRDLTVLRRIARRYLGDEMGDRYVAGVDPTDHALIRLAPGVLRAWDFADEYESR